MADITVTVKLGALSAIKKLRLPKYSKQVGELAVELSKELIASGTSPVRKFGRFVEYSGQRNRRAAGKSRSTSKEHGYPFSVQSKYPDKKVRPVNLKLSGDMLEAFTFKTTATGALIGVFDQEQKKKAVLHNNGGRVELKIKRKISTKVRNFIHRKKAQKTIGFDIPQRKFVPSKAGDDFVISISRAIKNLYSTILEVILKE